MSSTAVVSARPGRAPLRRHRGRGRATVVVAGVIVAGIVAPLALLVLDARAAGWREIRTVLFRGRSAMLLQHTVTLAVLVCVLAAVVGVGAAWATERGRLPWSRAWTVLLMLPLAMPDFVVGWAWHALDPQLNPLGGATLVMTLGTYPLVYLPVAAALRRLDPALEDSAHSLGVGGFATFLRVGLPQVAPAVLGGSVLVVLTVISEYGAFEVLRYPTFTTEVFTEFQFEPQAAGALSLPLVLLGLAALSAEAAVGRRLARGDTRVATRRARRPARGHAGAVPLVAALTVVVGLGVAVPVGTLVYWMTRSRVLAVPPVATLGQATAATLGYSAAGALVAVLLALPVALVSRRRRSRARTALARLPLVMQAVPGVVVALSLVYFATRYAYGLYQTSALLIVAYAILHFPLALVCVQASATHAPVRLTDLAASLGSGRVTVFTRITLPLLAPGLAAGFCLVFLTAITELTATLVLAPIGVATLATQFWSYQSEIAYGAAAPYALVIIVIAVLPGALLGLWFDRDTRAQAPADATPQQDAVPAPPAVVRSA